MHQLAGFGDVPWSFFPSNQSSSYSLLVNPRAIPWMSVVCASRISLREELPLIDDRSKGAPGKRPPRGPNSFIFMQFLARKLQSNRLAQPFLELVPARKILNPPRY